MATPRNPLAHLQVFNQAFSNQANASARSAARDLQEERDKQAGRLQPGLLDQLKQRIGLADPLPENPALVQQRQAAQSLKNQQSLNQSRDANTQLRSAEARTSMNRLNFDKKREEQEVGLKTRANQARFLANSLKKDPSRVDQVMQQAQQFGLQLPTQQSQVSIPGESPIVASQGDADANSLIQALEGQATGVLGAADPTKKIQPLSPEGKLVQDMFQITPADPEFGERVQGFIESEKAAQRAVESAKVSGEAATNLRKEFQNLQIVKKTIEAQTSFRKVQSAGDNAAGDMSLIFGYMKILDPGSTVREGEAAAVEKSQGWTDQARTLYNKAVSGRRMAPAQIKQFKKEASKLFAAQNKVFDIYAKNYRRLAENAGVNPDDVVLTLEQGKKVTNDNKPRKLSPTTTLSESEEKDVNSKLDEIFANNPGATDEEVFKILGVSQ